MLIKYYYTSNKYEEILFYQHNSNIIPRIGETVIFDEMSYDNCVRDFKVVNGEKIRLDTYIIDKLDTDMFTVTNVCYSFCGEDIEVDINVVKYNSVSSHKYYFNEDYLKNLAKDVNIPNDYNR